MLEQTEGKTLMQYEGEIQIGGRLANAGQRLLDTASKSLIRQGLESLNSALLARAEAAEEGRAVDYVPPTETTFAIAVAKGMVREVLPPPQTLGIILAILAAVLAIGYWLGRKGRVS